MNIGELFINLGIKGAEKAGQAIAGVTNSLKDVSSSGLAAKAAIVGVIYGLEQMMSASAKEGMGLQQFTNLTGISTDALQRWQFMARQSGVAAEEMSGSLKSVQDAMTAMLTGHGAPEGLTLLGQTVGFDPSRARDTLYVMGKLREFAQATKDTPDIANRVLGSFGLSPGTIQMLRTSKVELDKINPKSIYSGGEIEQLSKVQVAWMNLSRSIEMAFGHLTAKKGLGIVSQIQQMTTSIIQLVTVLASVAEKLKIFEAIGEMIKGLAVSIGFISDQLEKVFGKIDPKKEGGKSPLLFSPAQFLANKAIDAYYGNNFGIVEARKPQLAGPPSPDGFGNTNNMNIVVHNHGVKDAQEAASHVKREVSHAVGNSRSRNRGS